MEDVLVVLEAGELDCVEVLAAAEASFVAVPPAAFHPERTLSLVHGLNGRRGRWRHPAIPRGSPSSTASRYKTVVGSSTPQLGLSVTAPSRQSDDHSFRRWAAEYQRAIAPPGVSRRIINMIGEADVRGLLGFGALSHQSWCIKSGNQFYSVDAGRVMAAGIPGSPASSRWTAPTTCSGSEMWSR